VRSVIRKWSGSAMAKNTNNGRYNTTKKTKDRATRITGAPK